MKQTIVIQVMTGFYTGFDELLGIRQVESTEAAWRYLEELIEKEVEFRGEEYPAGINFRITPCGHSDKPNFAYIDYDKHGKKIEQAGHWEGITRQRISKMDKDLKDLINDTDTKN